MEVLAAVASVAGVLSLTIDGIETIGKLKAFCDDFKTCNKLASEFFHDLTVLATLLGNVKGLCTKLNMTNVAQKPDFHLASMQIQVEDCTHDLERWLDVARRYERGIPDRGQHKSRLSVRAAFKAFTVAVDKESRVAVRTRFGEHMENIQASLSLLGRELDLLHAQDLQLMDSKMQKLSETVQRHAKSQDQRLEELSNSGSSNLAISVSNEERLKSIQCTLTDLLETMSSTSSSISSERSSKVAMNSVYGRLYTPATPEAAPKSPSTNFPGSVGRTNVSGHDLYANLGSQSSLLSESVSSQLPLLSESTNILAKGTAKWFPPAVSEYVLTFCASRTLKTYANILVLPIVSVDSRERSALSDIRIEAARRTCHLRDICRAASLHGSLDLADGLLGVGVKEIEDCEELADQKLTGENQHHDSIIERTDHNQISMDKTTRINEWLLGVLQAKSKETSLHKAIIQDLPGYRERYSTDDSFEKEWPRLVLKYWFQDGAGDISREQSLLTSSLGVGWDSDRTLKLDDYTAEIDELIDELTMHHPKMALESSAESFEGIDPSGAPVMILQPALPLMDLGASVEEDENASLLEERWCGPKLTDKDLCEVIEG